jgi:hypothetical protein
LNRLYERVAPRRAQQEATLARQEGELRQAQMPTTFDERQSSRLLRDIETTRKKLAADSLASRADALKILTPVQRSQLQALAVDPRFRLREDRLYQLLMAPVDAPWSDNGNTAPVYDLRRVPNGTNRKPVDGRYGVYGGYGYGQPQYGVYGSVGQGPVGIYGGVGRRGPSIGIGIGGIFGLGRHRW